MTAPLTIPECDLRGMPYMPLDVVRLMDSDLFALSTGDEFKAAVALWCKSFLQVPAASLPDDDRILAHLSGSGARWAKVRAMALRGWVKCEDGRLYHPVIAEKAMAAWNARLAQRARTEAARAAKSSRKASDSAVTGSNTPPVTETVATPVTDNVTGSKGEGEGKGELKKKEETPHTPRSRGAVRGQAALIGFEDFWRYYPRRVGKGEAEKAWPAAVAAAGGDPSLIVDGVKCRLHLPEVFDPREAWRFCPHPSTWLRRRGWEDDIPGVDPSGDDHPFLPLH